MDILKYIDEQRKLQEQAEKQALQVSIAFKEEISYKVKQICHSMNKYVSGLTERAFVVEIENEHLPNYHVHIKYEGKEVSILIIVYERKATMRIGNAIQDMGSSSDIDVETFEKFLKQAVDYLLKP